MRRDILFIFLLWISTVIQLLVSTYEGVIYPSFLEIFLWYLLLFYPDKWYLIGLNILLLEVFSLPPVTGFYLLLFLLVAGGLYLGKDMFYIESRLFVIFYLLLIEVVKWLMIDYVYLILQVPISGNFLQHFFYLILQVLSGILVFEAFDKFLHRVQSVELVK